MRHWEYHTCTDLNWRFNEYAAIADLRIYFCFTYLSYPNALSSLHCHKCQHLLGGTTYRVIGDYNGPFNDEPKKEVPL